MMNSKCPVINEKRSSPLRAEANGAAVARPCQKRHRRGKESLAPPPLQAWSRGSASSNYVVLREETTMDFFRTSGLRRRVSFEAGPASGRCVIRRTLATSTYFTTRMDTSLCERLLLRKQFAPITLLKRLSVIFRLRLI